MKISEILLKAKALIDTPEKWTTEVFARDKWGEKVTYDSPNAVCFCSFGAIARVTDNDTNLTDDAVYVLADLIEPKSMAYGTVYRFNDTRTHEQVMWLFDKGIEVTQARERLTA